MPLLTVNIRRMLIILIVTLSTVLFIIFFACGSNRIEEKEILISYTEPYMPVSNKKLFNLDLEYIINSSACENNTEKPSSILAVIMVTSYFGNVETRSAMRRAFPQEKLQEFGLRRVFLLGTAPDDKYTSQNAVLHESKRFGDLLQGNFKEAYRNLTYKHMMGIMWAARCCKHAQYIIKMDDDIVINVYKVVALLRTLKFPQNSLAGYVLRGMTPIREPANKWYVTTDEYSSSTYPIFISGWFYITNPHVCQKLAEASMRVPYFWVDDVYVTGLLAQKLHVKHYSLGEHFTVHPEFLQCCMRDVDKFQYDCDVLVGPNGGDNNLFFTFNEQMTKCYYDKCLKRLKPLNQTCVAEKKYSLGRGSGLVETYRLA